MRRLLRILALVLATVSLLGWLAGGPNLGWTKTSVTIWQIDPVTDLKGPVIEKRFVPGVDLLGAGLAGAALLFGLSFLKLKTRNIHPVNNTP